MPVFRIGTDGDCLVAEWQRLGELRLNRASHEFSFTAEAGADPLAVEKVRLGPVRALVRHVTGGGVTLHASAVSLNGRALAFLGDSGVGKSTLAFALASMDGEAFSLLSDDCLAIVDGRALPTEGASWLDDGARRLFALDPVSVVKRPVSPPRVSTQPAPLERIFHLVYGEKIEVRRLRGQSAAAVLSHALIRFSIDDPGVQHRDLDTLASLAERVDVCELSRPRGAHYFTNVAAALTGRMS